MIVLGRDFGCRTFMEECRMQIAGGLKSILFFLVEILFSGLLTLCYFVDECVKRLSRDLSPQFEMLLFNFWLIFNYTRFFLSFDTIFNLWLYDFHTICSLEWLHNFQFAKSKTLLCVCCQSDFVTLKTVSSLWNDFSCEKHFNKILVWNKEVNHVYVIFF